MSFSKEQNAAFKKIPACVDTDQLDGTWDHVVFRVEHPIIMFAENGEYFYTQREALACQKWLQKYASDSEYANYI